MKKEKRIIIEMFLISIIPVVASIYFLNSGTTHGVILFGGIILIISICFLLSIVYSVYRIKKPKVIVR